MFDEKGRFVIENYNKQSTFSSFLPGISGLNGIPIWCFYVNRGQAIASFGTEDKNHSIMEFYPAHQAYQFTKTMGFRTFIKVDGEFYEPFYENNRKATMYIGMNELEIEELNEDLGIQVNVLYYTLPNENLGGLVRRITIQNKYKTKRHIELLDGMPAIIPYGIELSALKEMAQTMKAWMQVEDVDLKLPYYRVRYSTKDSAKVSKIEEGNYFISMTEEGERLSIIADPQIIFEQDTSYQQPEGFKKLSLQDLVIKKQILQNQVPSSFCTCVKNLGEREDFTVNTVIGQAANKQIYHHFADRCQKNGYFKDKYEEAKNLTKVLSRGIDSKTNNKIFDEYSRQTYVDNVLRGGYPIKLGNNHIFYVYSRKHGDIERDYNFFRMLPEYYSQGNGNFRDVNQNRRSDVLYSPYVKDYNIKTFYNLIQLDGYNPLVVKQITYQLQDFNEVCSFVDPQKHLVVEEFLKREFSPGQLLDFLEKEEIELTLTKESFLEKVICHSKQNLNADFSEGYWVDHWTYNLDLIETYLKVYPEEEENLLFEDNTYSYYESKAIVLPRSKRYVETENGVRQYHCVDEVTKEQVEYQQVRSRKGTGDIYVSNLFTKLLVIIQNRFASLDMFGMGIEMEGGKPGWYDALNGLPGMFGSSMAETYELQRLLLYVRDILEAYPRDVEVFSELYEFMMGTMDMLKEIKLHEADKMQVWNQLNLLKEEYREKTIWGVEGTNQIITKSELGYLINLYISYVEDGIRNAMEKGNGLCPTYFYYNLEKYKKIDGQIVPLTFQQAGMPLFLEGFVRYLKLPNAKKEKLKLYNRIQKSSLYDEKLKMYKVNESLSKASFEVGRAKAFSPGWLENESIWLHMEYKYLLQLLKNGLYEGFFHDLRNICIPFLDYSTYGRSLLENSSFLASSANLDEGIHGKGFVARLSGSTAEFLEMWQVMMFGEKPFQMWNGNLICSLKPSIPSYLICENNCLEATFLGSIKVIYQLNKKNDLIPESYRIDKITVEYLDGRKQCFQEIIDGSTPIDIRNGEVSNILCEIRLL